MTSGQRFMYYGGGVSLSCVGIIGGPYVGVTGFWGKQCFGLLLAMAWYVSYLRYVLKKK